MKYNNSIMVTVDVAMEMQSAMDSPDAGLGEEEVLFDAEQAFKNGNRMVVQVIAGSPPEDETAWSQAVLLSSEGQELACTEPSDKFIDFYRIKYEGNEYVTRLETNMGDIFNQQCPDCYEEIPFDAVNGTKCSRCGLVFQTPSRYPVYLQVQVDAVPQMLREEVADLLNTLINAGLSEAADSSELAEEDQMEDVEAATDLHIHAPLVLRVY